MEPEEPSSPPPKPLVRWLAIPLAFAWLGVMLTAPFVVISEGIVAAGFFLGVAAGLWVAANKAAWVREATKDRPQPQRRERSRSTGERIAWTVISLTLAGVVIYGSGAGTGEKGPFFFMAMFLMISLARRLLRRAWDLTGSFLGMMLSGSLLLLLLKSGVADKPQDLPLAMGLAMLLIVFEAFDELRAIRRKMNRG
jgi:hypothetical protein